MSYVKQAGKGSAKSNFIAHLLVQVMSTISSSEKIIPTTIEYLDIAGLVKGASQGEGLGNKFLSNIRECDSIVQARFMPVHCICKSLPSENSFLRTLSRLSSIVDGLNKCTAFNNVSADSCLYANYLCL